MRTKTEVRAIARYATIAAMGAAVLVATADGFAQSYAGLLVWAHEHQMAGWKADSFPLLVDLFVAVGEMGLFLLAIDGHQLSRRRALPWVDLAIPALTAAAGWAVSLVFNVGHIHHGHLADQVTAAVPPVAAMVGLVILLRTLHRYVTAADTDSTGTNATTAAPVADASGHDGPPAVLAATGQQHRPELPMWPLPQIAQPAPPPAARTGRELGRQRVREAVPLTAVPALPAAGRQARKRPNKGVALPPSARKPAAPPSPRTLSDAQLADRLTALITDHAMPAHPSIRQTQDALGVGFGRAKRVLALLPTTTAPAADQPADHRPTDTDVATALEGLPA